MKKTFKWETFAEWCLLALMIAVMMGMGAMRVHQLQLNLYLVAGYAAIVLLMACYRLVYRKWFAKEEAAETNAEEK